MMKMKLKWRISRELGAGEAVIVAGAGRGGASGTPAPAPGGSRRLPLPGLQQSEPTETPHKLLSGPFTRESKKTVLGWVFSIECFYVLRVCVPG